MENILKKIIDKKNFSSDLIITAETKDKVIMGIMHNKYNIHGVQFRPESIKTLMGLKILKNLITLTSPVKNKIVFNTVFILDSTILNINLNY